MGRRERLGEEEGRMCGPVSVSLQFRAVARRRSPAFAYESGSEERSVVRSVYVATMIRGQTIARNYANPVAVARCLGEKRADRARGAATEWTMSNAYESSRYAEARTALCA
ncbi:hypothetical protein KM043_010899 [Ampulex compressa]|nr:hypothetical protein KM043_010899 [Ampulex compressa]